MKTKILLLIMIMTVSVFAQTGMYTLSIGNQRYIDSTGLSSTTAHHANILLFDVRLENLSPDTLEYSAGQYYFQADSASFNDGEPVFYLLNSQLPEEMLFSEVEAYDMGDSVQLCCPNKKLIGKGQGYNVAPGTSVLIGIFELKTTAESGFAAETISIRWRDYLNSDNPLTKIVAAKANRFINLYRDCNYVITQ